MHSDPAYASTAEAADQIGFIGLGRMGLHMARNLSRAGYGLNVYNRSREKALALSREASCCICESAAEVASRCDVIFTMVSDGEALAQVFCGSDGVISGLRPGAIAVDMSTVGPDTIATLNVSIKDAGGSLVDAPVSGSVDFAEKGTLLVMVGGQSDDVARVRPYLEIMGSTVVYLGASGSGAGMKLAVNTVIYALIESVAEALVLAEQIGIDRNAAYDVLSRSAAAAPLLAYRRGAFEDPHGAKVQFALSLAEKDLTLVVNLAAAVGASTPQASMTRHVLHSASASGFADLDVSGVAEFLRQTPADRLRALTAVIDCGGRPPLETATG